ncbi:hypothetical protein I316_06116 [Kwoniella heveanensis BCC8398]|uniref:Uncharacterized protein n=1 Tax=Kwoniella heveanensis BCC8398 TaxID=1296120 RepID=A0A1B9GMG2_9TREE|nr:hypothetical protein I316_06116 [Kwoniella heveanensis BCC8398]
MSGKQITLTYALQPPASVPQPTAGPSSQPIPSSSEFTAAIPPSPSTASGSSSSFSSQPPLTIRTPTSDTARYYTDLTQSVREVQVQLNEILTGWKEAVGDLEKNKEDLGTVAYGRGRATVMSLTVNGEFREDNQARPSTGEADSESEGSEDE